MYICVFIFIICYSICLCSTYIYKYIYIHIYTYATAHLEESIGQLLELMEKQKTFEVQMARGTEEDSSKDQGSMDVDEELLGAALSDPVFSSLGQSARRKLCEELDDALAKRRRVSKSPLPGCG